MNDTNMQTCVTVSDAAPHHPPRRSTTALCHVCGKILKCANSLRTHCAQLHAVKLVRRRQCTGDENAMVALCQYCGKVFNHTGDLRKHEDAHNGIRPFVCDFESCGMGFTTSSNLARHKRTHSGIKIFQCIFCGCQYTRKDTFNDHLKRMHYSINK